MIVLNFVLFLLIAVGQIVIYWSIQTNSMSTADSTRRSRDMAIARRLFAIVMSDFTCWFPVGLLGVMASTGIPVSAFNDDCVRQIPARARQSIMVWAGFTYDHKIALEVIDGNMTAVKYRDDILRDVILPFKQQHPVENFILVDDNATSHRARIVQA
nr:hypothetical protein BaRGS_027631 [Batillaria attramentaria]